jgi:histidinol dehydrogenase
MRVFHGLSAVQPVLQGRGGIVATEAQRATVSEIIAAVRAEGDVAVARYSARFDGVALDEVVVSENLWAAAEAAVSGELKEAIAHSIARVRAFYQRQPQEGFVRAEGGAVLGLLTRPLARVACYIPGGTAPLFSSLIMTAVPAQVAGVPEIVVATPPRRDGSVAPELLVTARLLGLSTVYRVGGAQAIAALAYGTAAIPKVDKIVGPGNTYVVLAMQQVFGAVGIASLPGPTETLVLADDGADPEWVAADLLAQAEHVYAQAVLVTPSEALWHRVEAALARQLATLPTAETARAGLARGFVVIVSDLTEGLAVANAYAPEHLCLLVRDPWAMLPKVRHAGGVFLGEHSLEALGDYLAGPSHVMPTAGTARFGSALNVRDFQTVIPLVAASGELLREIGPAAAQMARAEGLEAHARAIMSRLKGEE